MKVKKIIASVITLLAIVFCGVPVSMSAQAQTFEQRIPNYGLYCSDADVQPVMGICS